MIKSAEQGKMRFKTAAAALIFAVSALAGCTGSNEPIPSQQPEPTPVKVSQEELLDMMQGSVYKDNIDSLTPSGLASPGLVGVDRAGFEEVKYAVPADTEFAGVYNAADYGITPSNNDNYGTFTNLLSQIKQTEGKKKVYFSEGAYRFSSTVALNGFSDLYICGNLSEWVMTEWTTALSFNACQNIHINGINFDYYISPSVSGKVVSADSAARTVTIKINNEFDLTNYRYNGGKVNFGNYMEYYFDEMQSAYVPDIDGMLRYNSTGDSVKSIENGTYKEGTRELTLTFNTNQGAFRAPSAGKTVSVSYTMYEYTCFMVKNCENFYMENCNIYSAPGMAITCYSCKNMYFNRTSLMLRPGSARLVTATADGLHTIDCYGDLIVTNSIYEASHDDSMNICTFYFKVDSFLRNALTCTATTSELRYPINEGDTVEIYDKNSMKLLYTRKVTESAGYGMTYELKLDTNIPSTVNISGCLVANATRVPRLKIDNCIFRNKRNRGILAQVQKSEITNCAFVNIVHGPVMIHSAQDVFSEAIVPRDITVKNCKFIGCNSGMGLGGDVAAFRHGGTIEAGTITGIEVSNNFFYGSAYSGVYFCATGNSKITDNLFYDICRRSASGNEAYRAAAVLSTVTSTEVKNNYVYFTNPVQGFEIIKDTSAEGTAESGNGGFNV